MENPFGMTLLVDGCRFTLDPRESGRSAHQRHLASFGRSFWRMLGLALYRQRASTMWNPHIEQVRCGAPAVTNCTQVRAREGACLRRARNIASRMRRLRHHQARVYIMETPVEVIEAAALQLPASERARLVERLIASLDAEQDVEAVWMAEIERRHAEIESGSVSLVPMDEAMCRLKAEFR
jgi:putative addiction module component (TIGR02574 family)